MNRLGLSLVEIVVALLLLTVGSLATVATLAAASRMFGQASRRSHAVILAAGMRDRILAGGCVAAEPPWRGRGLYLRSSVAGGTVVVVAEWSVAGRGYTDSLASACPR